MEDILVNYFCHIRVSINNIIFNEKKNISEKVGDQLLCDLESIHVRTEKDLHNRVNKYISELSPDDLKRRFSLYI